MTGGADNAQPAAPAALPVLPDLQGALDALRDRMQGGQEEETDEEWVRVGK